VKRLSEQLKLPVESITLAHKTILMTEPDEQEKATEKEQKQLQVETFVTLRDQFSISLNSLHEMRQVLSPEAKKSFPSRGGIQKEQKRQNAILQKELKLVEFEGGTFLHINFFPHSFPFILWMEGHLSNPKNC
jgi:hypothetical protein